MSVDTPHTETILDSIADGVFTIDLDWIITSFNRAAEDILGVSREQAIGKRCYEVFRADICEASCALRETMESGREVIARRISVLNGDGLRVPISISTAVLRDGEGRMVGGVESFRDMSELEILRKEIRGQNTLFDIISKNREIQRILDILPDIATSGSTVLIEGPSGSGKELFARAVHNLSQRKRRKYLAVNCGALPDTLLESELFGYVKGAFTDAKKSKPGRFALAEGGTLFLDEIGDISQALQVKLLRVLQEREYEPLGATTTVKTNARIIAATNKDLSEQMARGLFREDLYYRLNVVRITLPGLVRRREDIPLLVEHFVEQFNAGKDRDITGLTDEAMAVLMRHDFPGNVRELENIIEYAFVLCREGLIESRHLPSELLDRFDGGGEVPPLLETNPLEDAEAQTILDVLRKHNGNRRLTAQELGLHKTTLWRKMKRLGLTYSPGE